MSNGFIVIGMILMVLVFVAQGPSIGEIFIALVGLLLFTTGMALDSDEDKWTEH